ncbi:hypothetical protein ACWYXJ_29120 [Janthinobacterium lividum]
MNTEQTMRTLNGARRAIGLSGQGLGCSPVVVATMLKQIDRIGAEALPTTVAALTSILEKKAPMSEKVAASSLSEINALRSQVKMRLTQEMADAVAEREENGPDEMAPGRPN